MATEVQSGGRFDATKETKETMDTTQSDLYELLKEQNFECALTGRKLTPEASSLDHKTPMARGGTNDRDNLQWLSEGVNAAKGNMNNEEFIAMCREVIAHVDR